MILQLASMLCACVAVLAQSNVHNMDEYFRWKADRPVDLLQSTYTDQAMELLRQRRDTLDSITTVDGWRERQVRHFNTHRERQTDSETYRFSFSSPLISGHCTK